MAKNTINDKSKQISIRIPHDVMEAMESVKPASESNAGFIVGAMRGEIARRQSEGGGRNLLVTALDSLLNIEEIGLKANKDIQQIIEEARVGLGITPKSGPKS